MASISKTLDSPLLAVLRPEKRKHYCNYCLLSKNTNEKDFHFCPGCKFICYCSDTCQLKDFSLVHDLECDHFGNNENKLQLLTRDREIYVYIVALFKLFLMQKNGRLDKVRGIYTGRSFADLMSHRTAMENNSYHRSQLDRIVCCLTDTFADYFDANSLTTDDNDFLRESYCKLCINVIVLSEWTDLGFRRALGISLCLDASVYDHSCVPNVLVENHGRSVYIVGMDEEVDLEDVGKSFICYIDIASPRQFRQALLSHEYFFDCTCPRCADVESEGSNLAMLCSKCRGDIDLLFCAAPTLLNEAGAGVVVDDVLSVKCSHCGFVPQRQNVAVALHAMELFGQLFDYSGATLMKGLYDHALSIVRQVEFYRKLPEDEAMLFLKRVRLTARTVLSPNNFFMKTLNARLSGFPACNADVRAEGWLAGLDVVTHYYPPLWGYLRLEHSHRTAHALLAASKWEEAENVLLDVEKSLVKVFSCYPCPFLARIEMLRKCLDNKLPPPDPVEYEMDNGYVELEEESSDEEDSGNDDEIVQNDGGGVVPNGMAGEETDLAEIESSKDCLVSAGNDVDQLPICGSINEGLGDVVNVNGCEAVVRSENFTDMDDID